MNPAERSSLILRFLRSGVADGYLPGAVFRVGRPGSILAEGATGTMGTPGRSPNMPRDAMFDIASLTKPIVTATTAMLMLEEGSLLPETQVQSVIPEFQGSGKQRVTVGHLLDHSSGLPSWDALYLGGETAEAMLAHLYGLPLQVIPGQRIQYSCLGYILLGDVIQRVTGRKLDEIATERIFHPLRMFETLFRPPDALQRRIPPTDRDCFFERKMTGQRGAEFTGWVPGVLQGRTNDGNARSLGGVAGNAGLFSTAADLSRFAEMLLARGQVQGGLFLQPETLALMIRDRGEGRSLGWEIQRGSRLTSGGTRLSPGSFGHTGFTGVSLWIDPQREIFIILLTNRTFFGSDSSRFPSLRRRFHDRVIETLEEG